MGWRSTTSRLELDSITHKGLFSLTEGAPLGGAPEEVQVG